jgi:iron complex transport system substrate-binding protein
MLLNFHTVHLVVLCAILAWAQPSGASTEFRYAENVRIEDYPTHRLIAIKNIHRGSGERFQYALIPKNQSVPDLPKGTTIVRTPVERVVIMTTTFIGFMDALETLDQLVGVSDKDLISHPDVRQRIENGNLAVVSNGQNLNVEDVILLQPDLILATSSGESAFDVHPQLQRAGLPVAMSSAWMEQHPLARAEWIKFIGALLGKEELAHSVFEEIAGNYEHLQGLVADIPDKPTVFCGAPYAGTWYVPGGTSYMATAIHDAGGNYVWADDATSGGIPLDLERVFFRAANADIWINPSWYRSMDELLAADRRFGKFKPAAESRVFNNSFQITESGGNNFWERGTVRADEVLSDLIKIFHPEVMADTSFVYYEHLK